jgi:hypothetical protein
MKRFELEHIFNYNEDIIIDQLNDSSTHNLPHSPRTSRPPNYNPPLSNQRLQYPTQLLGADTQITLLIQHAQHIAYSCGGVTATCHLLDETNDFATEVGASASLECGETGCD